MWDMVGERGPSQHGRPNSVGGLEWTVGAGQGSSRVAGIATEGTRGIVGRCCAPRPVGHVGLSAVCVCVCVCVAGYLSPSTGTLVRWYPESFEKPETLGTG